ncbi:MAG: hypothetical protein RI973_699 [Bacteroidota bacterium]
MRPAPDSSGAGRLRISQQGIVMKFSATIQHRGREYAVDFSRPIDLSMPLRAGMEGVNCFWAPPMEVRPVVAGDFVGSTELGGPVNFMNVQFNPHGNGTHTECVGHIAREKFSINTCLTRFHFLAKLVSLYPVRKENGDRVIESEQLSALVGEGEAEALIVRTLPNDSLKLRTNYSGSNPPYFEHEALLHLVRCGVVHLLTDLPSVDREEDGGRLLSHRAFWQYGSGALEEVRTQATISELIYVPNEVVDGLYLLNLQIASFDIDVSPSKPVIYPLM